MPHKHIHDLAGKLMSLHVVSLHVGEVDRLLSVPRENHVHGAHGRVHEHAHHFLELDKRFGLHLLRAVGQDVANVGGCV